MPTYITLYKFTQQGASHMRELPQRLASARTWLEKMGGRSIGTWLTFGEHDLVGISEAPDDITVAAFAVMMAGAGNATSVTMRAFSEHEIGEIIKRIPYSG